MKTTISTMAFEETYDKHTAKWVLSLSQAEWGSLFYDKTEYEDASRHNWDEDQKGLAAQHGTCRRLMMRIVRSKDGEVPQEYRHSRATSASEMPGRTYLNQRHDNGTSGYQAMPKKLRSLMVRNRQIYDIDMCNAHPVIMEWLAKDELSHPCPHLEYYNRNRAAFLQENSVTKRDVLIGMYKDAIPAQTVKGKPAVRALFQEMQTIKNLFYVSEAFQGVSKSDLRQTNVKASFASRILGHVENCFLQPAMELAQSHGFAIEAPVFDGFMMRYPGEAKDAPAAVAAVLEALQDQTATANIKWAQKEFDELVTVPTGWSPTESKEYVDLKKET